MRRPIWLVLPLLAAAVAGVAALIMFLRPTDEDSVHLVVWDLNLVQPWCDESGLVCVTRESLEQGYALYTLEPNPYFRDKGCRAAWLPDFDLSQVGSEGRGAFRSPCSGATFDRLGRRLFGPSPRGLDRYAASGPVDGFEIDLTSLQPGLVDR